MSNISKEKVGIQKLVEAIVKQAVLDVKNCYGTDEEYFLNHYQKNIIKCILQLFTEHKIMYVIAEKFILIRQKKFKQLKKNIKMVFQKENLKNG